MVSDHRPRIHRAVCPTAAPTTRQGTAATAPPAVMLAEAAPAASGAAAAPVVRGRPGAAAPAARLMGAGRIRHTALLHRIPAAVRLSMPV